MENKTTFVLINIDYEQNELFSTSCRKIFNITRIFGCLFIFTLFVG